MLAFVNGQYVSDAAPVLTINDRSFLYGDGLFETIRITNGRPFLWREHIERLLHGAAFFKIRLPHAETEIEVAARRLLSQNGVTDGIVRIHLSRGPSERGYALPKEQRPTLVISTHTSPHTPHSGVKIITSTVRVLADDPLTQHKTANRLPNIMARREADEVGADEALIFNHRNEIAETSAANLFIVRGEGIVTPPLSAGALPGTTRAFVLRIAAEFGLRPSESGITVDDVKQSDAAFLTSAHWLVTPIISLDDTMLKEASPAVKLLRNACERAASG